MGRGTADLKEEKEVAGEKAVLWQRQPGFRVPPHSR